MKLLQIEQLREQLELQTESSMVSHVTSYKRGGYMEGVYLYAWPHSHAFYQWVGSHT